MAAVQKAILRRLYEEVINQGKLETLDQLMEAGFIDHNPPGPGFPAGIAGVKAVFTAFRAAFPDLHFEVEDMVTEFDYVTARYTMTGTHQGEFLGMAPTGKKVTVSGMDIILFKQSKLAERWGQQDTLALLQQLGAVPTPGQ
jgi:predicted ester cyclase